MKLNRQPITKKSEVIEYGLYDAITNIKTPEEAKQFLQDLCTPTEIQSMTDRWKVVAFIKSGMSYREIHAVTAVSITTIGRVARYINLGEGGYNVIYNRLEKKLNKNK